MTRAAEISETLERIHASRTVVILRLRDHAHLVQIASTLADAGLKVMEVTFDNPLAATTLIRLSEALGDSVVLGAGTVRTSDDVRRAADAGARFIVSPDTKASVIHATCAAGLASLPGATTATEVATALDAGAHLVKLFPAGALGPGYLRALRGPFGDVGFIPTGGIAHDELRPWYDAGAVAVGLGSDLVGSAATTVDETALAGLAQRAARVAEQAGQRHGSPR